jgi:hypothetical protein
MGNHVLRPARTSLLAGFAFLIGMLGQLPGPGFALTARIDPVSESATLTVVASETGWPARQQRSLRRLPHPASLQHLPRQSQLPHSRPTPRQPTRPRSQRLQAQSLPFPQSHPSSRRSRPRCLRMRQPALHSRPHPPSRPRPLARARSLHIHLFPRLPPRIRYGQC